MKKSVMVILALVAMFLFTSVVGAEPLQYGAAQPEDGAVETYHGKTLYHSQEMEQAIEKVVEHATFFRHIYKGNVCDKNVKIGKGNFKVIGIYYWNEKMMGGYIKGLVRVNNEPNNLWWFEAQGVAVDNHTPSDFKMYMHKGDAEAYQDPTTIAFSRTQY